MEKLILEWQKRQQKYEELADKYKDDAHNNRKFTYKAMATRDCWKELALQLPQPDVIKSVCDCGKPIDSRYAPCCSLKCWDKKFL